MSCVLCFNFCSFCCRVKGGSKALAPLLTIRQVMHQNTLTSVWSSRDELPVGGDAVLSLSSLIQFRQSLQVFCFQVYFCESSKQTVLSSYSNTDCSACVTTSYTHFCLYKIFECCFCTVLHRVTCLPRLEQFFPGQMLFFSK